MPQSGPIAVLAQLSVVIFVNASLTGTVRKKLSWKMEKNQGFGDPTSS